jgi:ABC-2 type transport system ATP-binding protein
LPKKLRKGLEELIERSKHEKRDGKMIELDGLTRKFGELIAVDNLTFTVGEGEVFGLLGPNGAGKTTTVRMLCCLIRPTSGKAFVGGFEVGKDSLKIREIVGLLPENPGLYDELSAYRNLDFFAKLYDVPEKKRKENIEYFLRMLDLWNRKDELVGTFSKGMKQKIAIARALVHEPKVLFLDEPTAGLDPEAAMVVREFILELKKERRTIFICTHNLDEAEKLCDRIAILNHRVVAMGSPAELERGLWEKTTVVHLRSVNENILKAIEGIEGVRKVEAIENKLLINVDEPEMRNPLIVRAIVNAGGEIEFVTELKRGLEEVYMRLIGGKNA